MIRSSRWVDVPITRRKGEWVPRHVPLTHGVASD